jgi:hypothetical protein
MLAVVLAPSALLAQTGTATLSGVVIDESGALLPGAALTLTRAETALERQALATEHGAFNFSFVPAGRYSVTARREGFAPGQLKDIVLNVGDDVSVRISLKVGAVTDSIFVVDDARTVTQSGTVGTTIDRTFFENQPLNGRSFQSMITLTPGVVLTKGSVGTQGQFSINGQRASTNYFTVDGVSANFGTNSTATLYEQAGGGTPAYSSLGGTNTLASVDAVQEFSIQTSTYAPEFGRQPGAQVQIVTRSGTNKFHGSVFEYFRNDALDANDFFANRNRQRKAALRQNNFGFVLGGPLAGRKSGEAASTFFFLSYEGLRLLQPQVGDPAPVPSIAARQAATGVARDLLSVFPIPNGPVQTSDPNLASFAGSFSNPSSINAGSVRIDHNLGNSVRLFGRYNHAPSDTRTGGFASSTYDSLTTTATAGATVIFAPTLTNDLRVNYSRARTTSRYDLTNFGGAIPPPDSSLFPSYANGKTDFSAVHIGSISGWQGFNAENQQGQTNIVDSVSWARGAHTIKFGFDLRLLRPKTVGAPFRRFLFFNSVADVMAGAIPSGNVSFADFIFEPRYRNFSAYVQDTWRASRRLTVTYGLRYEVNPAPTEKNDNLPYTVTGLDDPAKLQLNTKGTRFYETTFNNFAPRVGAAYAISQKANRETIIRGGLGVFYDLGYTFTGSAFSTFSYPYGRTVNFSNITLSSPILQAPLPPFDPNPPKPYQRLYAYADDYKLPYTLQYNISVEQSLGSAATFSAGYVGATGRRLGRVSSLRNPAAGFTRIDAVTNDAESQYHALQLQYRRRLSRGLQVIASYSLSESMDTVSDESIINFQGAPGRVDPNLDYGPSTFDIRHSFNVALSYAIPSPIRSGLGRAILGNFGIDINATARSASPVNILTGTDPLGLGLTTVARPDVVAGQPFWVDDANAPGGRRLNRAAFVNPPSGRQGTLGRNAVRAFGATQVDVSLRRQFGLSETANLQLRIDAFNIANHPNFADPVSALNNANFGLSTQMLGRSLHGGYGFNPLYQVGGPRSLQLSARIQF